MGNIISANHSNILVDGEAIVGAQSFTFKTKHNTEEVFGIGSAERMDVSFGQSSVVGSFTVKSYSPTLDSILSEKKKCQIVIKLKKQKGLSEDGERTVSLDEVFLEGKDFEIAANGVGQTTYHLTATRVRDE